MYQIHDAEVDALYDFATMAAVRTNPKTDNPTPEEAYYDGALSAFATALSSVRKVEDRRDDPIENALKNIGAVTVAAGISYVSYRLVKEIRLRRNLRKLKENFQRNVESYHKEIWGD